MRPIALEMLPQHFEAYFVAEVDFVVCLLTKIDLQHGSVNAVQDAVDVLLDLDPASNIGFRRALGSVKEHHK